MTEEVNTPYQRQRRNLFITSFAILAMQCAGINLDQLSLQGYIFKVGNPEFIFLALVVLVIYFAWRCYQFDYEYFSKPFESKIKDLLMKRFACVEQMIRDHYLANPGLYPEGRDHSKIKIKLEKYSGMSFQAGNVTWIVDHPTINFYDSEGMFSSQLPPNLKIPDSELKTARKKAKRIFIFNTPEFSEHYWPFIFAGLSLIIAVPWRIASYDWMNQMMIDLYH